MARLTKNDWLDHGLRTLADAGFVGLKADLLASSLGVSRGSFYHHFNDLADFHQAVLARWVEVTVVSVINQLEDSTATAADRLSRLIDIAAGDPDDDRLGALEQAVRAWGFSDPTVRAVVAEVDHQRITYVERLLHELGHDSAVATRRAILLYQSSIGYYFTASMLDPALATAARNELKALVTEPAPR